MNLTFKETILGYLAVVLALVILFFVIKVFATLVSILFTIICFGVIAGLGYLAYRKWKRKKA